MAKEKEMPESVSDLSPGAAYGQTAEASEPMAPKGTEYPEDTPEEDMLPIATKKQSGSEAEDLPIIYPGAFVRLGKHDLVPDKYEGIVAAVVEAPRYECHGCVISPRPHEHQPADTMFTVRTRDDADTLLSLPRDAFAAIGPEGRKDLLPHG